MLLPRGENEGGGPAGARLAGARRGKGGGGDAAPAGSVGKWPGVAPGRGGPGQRGGRAAAAAAAHKFLSPPEESSGGTPKASCTDEQAPSPRLPACLPQPAPGGGGVPGLGGGLSEARPGPAPPRVRVAASSIASPPPPPPTHSYRSFLLPFARSLPVTVHTFLSLLACSGTHTETPSFLLFLPFHTSIERPPLAFCARSHRYCIVSSFPAFSRTHTGLSFFPLHAVLLLLYIPFFLLLPVQGLIQRPCVSFSSSLHFPTSLGLPHLPSTPEVESHTGSQKKKDWTGLLPK